MAYILVGHIQRGQTRIMDVDTGTKDKDGNAVLEHFEWGMDVPLATVRRETKALLDAKYSKGDTVLAGVGTQL